MEFSGEEILEERGLMIVNRDVKATITVQAAPTVLAVLKREQPTPEYAGNPGGRGDGLILLAGSGHQLQAEPRDRVGALMVFERRTLLDDVLKTGTSLDCQVSAELLKKHRADNPQMELRQIGQRHSHHNK